MSSVLAFAAIIGGLYGFILLLVHMFSAVYQAAKEHFYFNRKR